MHRDIVGALALCGLLACGGEVVPEGDGGPARADAGRAIDAGRGRDAATGSDAGRPSACPEGPAPPRDATIELEHGGRMRRYLLHVPASVDPRVPAALVLNFHGFTSDGAQQQGLSRMNAKADAEGFVAVHPDGYNRSWNAGACCGDAASEGVDDVGLVRAIVRDVAGRACIDERRVYATGMSNGGFLSHRLACDASDVVTAIGPVAGVLGIPEADCRPARPVPVIHFHGTWDTLVPYDGNAMQGFPSVRDTMDGWARRNGCPSPPEVTFDMGNTRCETWRGCAGGIEQTLCTIDRGGHWWPGGPGSTASLSATDAMWDFFSRFAR